MVGSFGINRKLLFKLFDARNVQTDMYFLFSIAKNGDIFECVVPRRDVMSPNEMM